MVDCKMSIKKIFDRIKRVDKFDEFITTYGLTASDEKGGTKFAANFYKSSVVNYKGCVKDYKNLYSEVIAETLVNDNFIKDWLNLIPVRPEHFKINHPNKDECLESIKITNRKEEILAKLLFYQSNIDGLGYIFDYQTPLKKTKNDSYGKIDLLGYNVDDKCYSVIELKYRPSGSEETLLRCVLEAYTYYKLLDLKQIKADVAHEGINNLKKLSEYKHTDEAELVVLFDEKSCTKEDGGDKTNLMLRIDSSEPNKVNEPNYPSKTVVSQQYKECQELINPSKRKALRALCEAILKQESKLKQIRFVVLRTEDIDKAVPLKNVQKWSSELDRSYRAETLLTIPSKG
ncbi:hypothetical protein [Veillonella sp.]|uniref:hypothetical protein n=1 Tax=Veillonella sp. TaxID=1926307 RepID=UPI00352259C4